jgi:pimeloyl-ACP methyl ester carboxylesterase
LEGGAFAGQDIAAVRDCMRHNLLMHMIYKESMIDEDAIDIQTNACISCRFRSREISWSGGLFERLTKILENNSTQLLLIWGAHDVTGSTDILEDVCRMRIPNAKIRLMVDAGHWVQFEKADEVNKILLEWLRS